MARSSRSDAEIDLGVLVGQSFDEELGTWQLYPMVCLLRSRSKGRVRLIAADPEATLDIRHSHLAEPDDMEAMCDGVELVMDLMRSGPLRGIDRERCRWGRDAVQPGGAPSLAADRRRDDVPRVRFVSDDASHRSPGRGRSPRTRSRHRELAHCGRFDLAWHPEGDHPFPGGGRGREACRCDHGGRSVGTSPVPNRLSPRRDTTNTLRELPGPRERTLVRGSAFDQIGPAAYHLRAGWSSGSSSGS